MAGIRALVAASVGLVGAALPLTGGVAHAATGAVTVTVAMTQSNWYWREQSGNPCQATSATTVPDPVPAGDLAVAGPEGPKCSDGTTQPDKETYLAFDMSHVPMGSTIRSFRISLPVDASGATFVAGGVPAPAIACSVDNGWSGGQGAQSFAGKPKDTCATKAPRLVSADSGRSYTVDIAAIAQGWVTPGGANNGVAITDDPSNTTVAYQLVFGPAPALAKVVGTVGYDPPGAGSAPAGSASGAPGGTVSAPPSGSGEGLPAEPAPALPPSASGGPLPASPAPATPAPPTAGGVGTPAPASAPSRTARPSSSSSVPPAGFWAAGVVLFLLLALSSLFVTDESAGRARRGPTSRALDHLRSIRSQPLSEAP